MNENIWNWIMIKKWQFHKVVSAKPLKIAKQRAI
jgi:hypothetical protein